jgi:phospholipid/cholesterol/gamma-HCH transport system ATP-binding protein
MKEAETNSRDEVVVSIDNLHKSFEDNDVLKGISLEVHKGENVIILGRSGSGKSVLIRIIAGLIKQNEGTVEVLGKDINKLDRKALAGLRLKIGFLFQQGALYDSLTIRQNLEFPLRRNVADISEEDIAKEVNDALEAVDLADTADQYPAELSGGQEKRIAIARMLILKPEVILYDEPTGGLDPLTSVEINNLIKRVKERYKASSILITHDLTCAKETGDRIFVLIDGKFVRQGSFEEVFDTDDEQIRAFYDYYFIR